MPATKALSSYESLYIIRPNLDEDAVDRTIAEIESFIKGAGGTDISSEKKGRRKLAYQVNKMRDGYYVLTLFEAKPESISAIKRMMTLSEDVFRYLIVVRDKEDSSV